MAEDLAYLGYQPEAKLTLCPMGIINAYSKDNLATPQVQIDLRQHLQAAWPVLLDQLRERNIPIPQQLQTPHFFGASETVCVTTTRKALEVSAWMVDLGTINWNYNSNGYFNGNCSIGSKSKSDDENANVVFLKARSTSFNQLRSSSDDCIAWYSNVGFRLKLSGYGENDSAKLKNDLQGQYLIYPLADPIRIAYSDLGLPDINSGMVGITTDHILTLSDTDGLEMHRLEPVEWTDPEGNTHPAVITRYSRAYMDKHHAWPPALPMTFTGLQFTADYKEMRWLHDTVLKLITKYPV